MVPAVYRTTTLGLSAGEYTAEAEGHELQEPGFLQVWSDVRPEHGREELALPAPDVGTELPLDRAWPEPEETRPPPRYREGSLVSELKDRGIGRPSTYGDILTKIKRRSGFGYVRKTGSTLQPTEKGEALVEFLEDRYRQVVDYEYTARMEADLDRIEAGELDYTDFLEGEFTWLSEPYEIVTEKGWIETDRPSPAQIAYLESLAQETSTDVPEHVFESKQKVSRWIDKLNEQIEPTITLTEIYEAEVGDVDVYRFKLLFNEPLPEEVYEFLGELKFKYKSGNKDRLPGFQFQRQDRDEVNEVWTTVRDRYDGEMQPDGFRFEQVTRNE